MPNIRVTSFAGMIPALEDKLLPNSNASYALNCRLDNGKLRAFKKYAASNAIYAGDIAYDQKDDFVFTGVPGVTYPTLFRLLTQNFQNYDSSQTTYPYNLYPRVFGIDSSAVVRGIDLGSTRLRSLGVPPGPTVVLETQPPPANRSKFLAPVAYCATYVNSFGEESTPGVPTDYINRYEGDTLGIRVLPSFTPGVPDTFDMRKIRIYRTMSEYETGEQLGNKNNTEFHLVTELTYNPLSFLFNDTFTSDNMMSDLLLSREFFMPPQLDARGMCELELGFLAIAYRDGTIRLSERFQYHAFPIRNQITIPQNIAAMVAYYNTLFITCVSGTCYQIQVSLDPSGVKFDVQFYSDLYYSNGPRTLVRTNFGALFASQKGLMALNKEQQVLVSKDLILSQQWKTSFSPQYGVWIPGYYLGINSQNGQSWLMDVPDQISGQTQFGKLTYVDHHLIPIKPDVIVQYNMVYGKDKLYIRVGADTYTWDGLETEPSVNDEFNNNLIPYTWRSKIFVMPALTTFAAAKVVMKTGFVQAGNQLLRFRLFGDGYLRYERNVTRDLPFRLPHLFKAMNWQFELIGTDQIDEVHIATSMTDLIRLNNEPA